MLLDLAAAEPLATVERAYNQAQVLKLLAPAQLEARLEAWSGRRGTRLLQALLDDHGVSRSELEDAFRVLIRSAGLTQPAMNQWVEGVYADAVWHAERVVVELDGRAFHRHDHAFEGDRAKANRLALRGWTVLRFTYRRLTHEPYAVIAELVTALNRQAGRAA